MQHMRNAEKYDRPLLQFFERVAPTYVRGGGARLVTPHRVRRSALDAAPEPQGTPITHADSSVAVLEHPATVLPLAVVPDPHILLVEDDPQVARVITEMLALEGDSGWRVNLATDGQHALESAFAAPPRIVLLDVLLPGLDGGEVYRRLRANPRTTGTHVIFLSAATSLDLYQKGIDGGVLLRKPFESRELVRLVHALLAE